MSMALMIVSAACIGGTLSLTLIVIGVVMWWTLRDLFVESE